MSRKQLEIQLSQKILPFSTPDIEFEQYQTPPRVAANLLHIAWTRGDIEDKTVIDICAGTGILGLGAAMLGAEATLVEIEGSAFSILQENIRRSQLDVNAIHQDIFTWKSPQRFDTAVLNPPFGIQQRRFTDMQFVQMAAGLADQIYAIHDGSKKNQEKLPNLYTKLGLRIEEAYIEQFPLDKKYPWHQMKRKIHDVLIIHGSRS